VRFHGHLGPYLILGLKAGLFVNETFGKDCFKTRAIIETIGETPYLCFVDGIQISTGCTMGKGNIELIEGDGISAEFQRDKKNLKIILRKEVFERLLNIQKGEEEKIAQGLSKKPIQELFEVR